MRDLSQFLFLVPDVLKEEVLSGCHNCPMLGHLGQKCHGAIMTKALALH